MNDSVIPATYRRLKTLADGTVQLVVEVEPKDAAQAFALFNEPHVPVAIARLACGRAAGAMAEGGPSTEQSGARQGPYGEWWRMLFQAGAFQAPPVLQALGGDDDYLEWLRDQRCVHCGQEPHWEMGDWVRNEAAHVRRVANGAGTAVKPPHSAITLCPICHRVQHKKGESALGGPDWVARKLLQQRNTWAKACFHDVFVADSLTSVPPERAVAWFESWDLLRYLPEGARVPGVLHKSSTKEGACP